MQDISAVRSCQQCHLTFGSNWAFSCLLKANHPDDVTCAQKYNVNAARPPFKNLTLYSEDATADLLEKPQLLLMLPAPAEK